MSRDNTLLSPRDRHMLRNSIFVRHKLEDHYQSIEHQTETARFGMWLFIATEVMFFGALFLSFGILRFRYPDSVQAASAKLCWQIGGANTLVLLLSSFLMTVGIDFARRGNNRWTCICLIGTILLGLLFLALKGLEYAIDYHENLIPGLKFDEGEWTAKEGLSPIEIGPVKMYLMMYWVSTVLHAIHLSVGIIAVAILAWLSYRGMWTSEYYSPVDVCGIYWHFVDIVWTFLAPMLYLLGTHHLGGS
jgi:cytochrome c oxidase subunit 3